MHPPRGIDPTSVVEEKRLLAPETHVGPGARLIGAVKTARGAFIDANACFTALSQ